MSDHAVHLKTSLSHSPVFKICTMRQFVTH